MGKASIRTVVPLVIFLSFAFSSISLTEAKEGGGVPLRAVHYMVMELDRRAGTVNLVHHQIVSAHVESETDAEVAGQMAADDAGKEAFEINVSDDYGKTVFRNVAEAPFVIRGEYQGKEGQIDGYFFEVDRSAFVVRVPVEGGKTLQMKSRKNNPRGSTPQAQAMDMTGEATEIISTFDLESLRHAKPSATDSFMGAPLAVGTSTAKNRVLILIMGDGYTEQEQGKFLVDAQKLKDEFSSITPYKEYANFIEWRILPVASNQSGADHPPYDPSCNNASCCSDPDAKYDPKAGGNGTYMDTAFDSRFCGVPSLQRALISDYGKTLTAAAAVPDWDVIWVIVNDATYGGSSSGRLSTFSAHESMAEVAQHEHGHSFTGLLDEYPEAWCDTRGCYPCEETKGTCGPNVTNESVRGEIKWNPLISKSTAIPTPDPDDWLLQPIGPGPLYPYFNTVGLFEVAPKLYRPQYDCAMHSRSAPFCAICTQEYVLRLYHGWGGVPQDGIDLIEPGSESPPPGTVSASGPITFKVDLLQPIGSPPLEIIWLVGGVQAAVGTNSFSYTPKAGNTKIELSVKDTTPLVNPAMAGDVLVSSRTWSISSEAVNAPILTGPAAGSPGESYLFTVSGSTDSIGYGLQYLFDWGDGTHSGWLSVGTTSASKSWNTPGVYHVKAQAKSSANTTVVSDWSNILPMAIASPRILLRLSTGQMKVRVANTVTVTATDEGGNKLPGASLRMDGCGQSLVATADEQGIGTFRKVKFTEAGQAVVTAQMPGFDTATATLVVVEKASKKAKKGKK